MYFGVPDQNFGDIVDLLGRFQKIIYSHFEDGKNSKEKST